ncbi:MAG: class I SAM-dependent methyltransferase [Phycisphaerales bacterium]
MTQAQGDRAGFYDDPLIYHVLHLQGTAAEVRVFERIARRHAEGADSGSLRWLEPASGSGRYLHVLAKLGHRGVGIDLSEGMNEFAAAEAKRLGVGGRLKFVTASMERFDAGRGRFDVAFNPINSVRHLASDKAVLDHLACVKRSLRRGGVYLVGVEVTPPGIAQPTEDVWQGRIAGLRVHQFVSYLPPEGRSRHEKVISHKTVIQGRGKAKVERHIDSVYSLRTYTREQWLTLLDASGWEVVACYGPTGRLKRFEPVGYCLQVLKPR